MTSVVTSSIPTLYLQLQQITKRVVDQNVKAASVIGMKSDELVDASKAILSKHLFDIEGESRFRS